MSTTNPESIPTAITPEQLRRERLRFADFRVTRTHAGRCSISVELEWLDRERVTGTAESQSSQIGDLRTAADAALRAIEQFAKGALAFELIGVKAMKVFDANVVIVAIDVMRDGGERSRLLGCYLAEDDAVRASAIAVLNATNRVLGNFIATR